MRLFVAINLPGEERDRIAAATLAVRESGLPVHWGSSDSYHLTLRFLGEVEDGVARQVASVVSEVAASHVAFPLRLRGAGVFPTPRQPTVWWLGIEPSQALRCLQQDLERGLDGLGFAPEQRPFAPHLTLGRTARDAVRAALAGAASLLQSLQYDRTITVETVDLMRSHLSPRGARHECIRAARLRP